MTTRVFVYEHLTSGAFATLPEAESLAREGRAMLAAVLADLSRCDGVEVVTLGGEDPKTNLIYAKSSEGSGEVFTLLKDRYKGIRDTLTVFKKLN